MPRGSAEYQRCRTMLPRFVGRTASVRCGPESLKVRVLDIHMDERGWSAVLCSVEEPGFTWTIGHFTWHPEEGLQACVFRDYWHITMLGERYLFESR